MWITAITFLVTVTSSSVTGLATDVRLVHGDIDGLKPYEGAVEVFMDGQWGPLLRHGIDDTTTKTICKILGFGYRGFTVQRFAYPGTPLLNQLRCSGNETSISQCKQEPGSYRRIFWDSPGIHCFDHVYTDIRLIPDASGTSNSGSVQVKMDGRWGLLRDYNSLSGVLPSPKIDKVLCRSLGYEIASYCKLGKPKTFGEESCARIYFSLDVNYQLSDAYILQQVTKMCKHGIYYIISRDQVVGEMDVADEDFITRRTNNHIPRRGSDHGVALSWINMDMTICNGTETSFSQCQFKPMIINQPHCYAIRAVTCITLLNGLCASNAICAAVPNAICENSRCVCRSNYRTSANGACVQS